jgi:hypothetical protein
MLVAELTDNDGWTSLIELAEIAGNGQLRERLQTALDHENEHLDELRGWVAAGTGRSVETARAMRMQSQVLDAQPRHRAGRGPERKSSARPKRRPKSRPRARTMKPKPRGRSAR